MGMYVYAGLHLVGVESDQAVEQVDWFEDEIVKGVRELWVWPWMEQDAGAGGLIDACGKVCKKVEVVVVVAVDEDGVGESVAAAEEVWLGQMVDDGMVNVEAVAFEGRGSHFLLHLMMQREGS
jgi:hypothetical protein